MRSLAHIETIKWKRPIEGADRIELVGVLGWQCIAKKDEFQIGDKCVYIEIDSIVDKDNPDFAFLENKKYRIKTMKMRGVISQGIVFPTSILHDGHDRQVGTDVTTELKIKEVEDEIPVYRKANPEALLRQRHRKLYKSKLFKTLMKFEWFRNFVFKILLPHKKPSGFPAWIAKTDETRLQNMPWVLDGAYANEPMVVTEKLDGTSTTFAVKKKSGKRYEFVICSRNLRIDPKTDSGCVYTKISDLYDMKNVLMWLARLYRYPDTIVLQGETIGEGIQGNKYKVKGLDFYAFNLIVDGSKVDSCLATDTVKQFGIKWVPIITSNFTLYKTVEEMIKFADGKSVIANVPREGVVIRDHKNTISFKCISNDFLLKHDL